jgi:hypothetical protein
VPRSLPTPLAHHVYPSALTPQAAGLSALHGHLGPAQRPARLRVAPRPHGAGGLAPGPEPTLLRSAHRAPRAQTGSFAGALGAAGPGRLLRPRFGTRGSGPAPSLANRTSRARAGFLAHAPGPAGSGRLFDRRHGPRGSGLGFYWRHGPCGHGTPRHMTSACWAAAAQHGRRRRRCVLALAGVGAGRDALIPRSRASEQYARRALSRGGGAAAHLARPCICHAPQLQFSYKPGRAKQVPSNEAPPSGELCVM